MANLTKIIPAIVGGIAGKRSAGKGLVGAGVGLVAARIAKRSVPGALLVGGAMVAKYLYDKKKADQAASGITPHSPANPVPPPPDIPASGR
jgi:hypothetical protein